MIQSRDKTQVIGALALKGMESAGPSKCILLIPGFQKVSNLILGRAKQRIFFQWSRTLSYSCAAQHFYKKCFVGLKRNWLQNYVRGSRMPQKACVCISRQWTECSIRGDLKLYFGMQNRDQVKWTKCIIQLSSSMWMTKTWYHSFSSRDIETNGRFEDDKEGNNIEELSEMFRVPASYRH